MNIIVNVLCHALVAVVSHQVVSLMRLSTQSLLGSCLATASYGHEGMTEDPKLCTD
jgi:hypothetical protein